jgi:hypothetical protein
MRRVDIPPNTGIRLREDSGPWLEEESNAEAQRSAEDQERK